MSDKDLLLVVDVQNDFCPGGALAVPDGDSIVPLVNDLAKRFKNSVFTQDWHPIGHRSFASSHPGAQPLQTIKLPYGPQVLWPDHCVQGTWGAALHAELGADRAQMIIRKGFHPEIDSYSAFQENDRRSPTGLAGYLRERCITRVFICGLATDFCVRWSALDARRAGFEAVVIEDACRGIDLEGSVNAARKEMGKAGVLIITASQLESIA